MPREKKGERETPTKRQARGISKHLRNEALQAQTFRMGNKYCYHGHISTCTSFRGEETGKNWECTKEGRKTRHYHKREVGVRLEGSLGKGVKERGLSRKKEGKALGTSNPREMDLKGNSIWLQVRRGRCSF